MFCSSNRLNTPIVLINFHTGVGFAALCRTSMDLILCEINDPFLFITVCKKSPDWQYETVGQSELYVCCHGVWDELVSVLCKPNKLRI